jgi:hypothetical protein
MVIGVMPLSIMARCITNLSITLKMWHSINNTAIQQHALRNMSNCLNANIYSHLGTSGGQSSKLYLNVVHSFNASVKIRHLWQQKSVVFLHRCLICVVLFHKNTLNSVSLCWVVMLNAITLSVVMLNVLAPFNHLLSLHFLQFNLL